MRNITLSVILLFLFSTPSKAQTESVMDDFEGNGTITTWYGDNCNINTRFNNPYQQDINTSATVMEYHDVGGQYANVRFDISENYDLSSNHTFSLKIFVPASGVTGKQPNQVSLKLQDGTVAEPWVTQSEIIKPVELDKWQTVSFNFSTDEYINLDPTSLPPTQRTDFNRVVIQVNGENNYDHVLAYIDDVNYNGPIPSDPEYDVLVWSDEFDAVGAVDNTKWHHETLVPNPWGWHGGEVQHYTDRIDNSYVSNGILHIVGKKETYTDQGLTKEYTSARLNSKFAFQYGKVEVRAKLPAVAGTLPAIWTLGKNFNVDGTYWATQGYGTTNWPDCGEIDIMEHWWGTNQNFVSSATHTPSSYGATVNLGGQTISNATTEFHTYTLKWYPEKLVFSVDGVTHYTYQPSELNSDTWPYNAEQFLLLNFAILPEIEVGFTEDALEIDYVRIYQSQKAEPTDISIDKNTFDENCAKSTVVGTFSTTAQDTNKSYTYSYSLINDDGTNDADNNKFLISGNELQTNAEIDYEKQNTFHINVQTDNRNGVTLTKAFVINANNLNDNAPVLEEATFLIDENSPNQTIVDTLTAADADGDLNTLTYSITSGNTNNAFAIDNTTGEITVNQATGLDFETNPEFNLTVEVSDGTNTDIAVITISLNNLIETGFEDFQLNQTDIYPNPAEDFVVVEINQNEDVTIELYNIAGKKELHQDLNKNNIVKTSQLKKGIYTYLIKIDGKQSTGKLIIQ